MPTLEQATQPLPANYERATPTPPADQPWQPSYNPNMRCPVPPTAFTPDTSQQFYRGGTVPQHRVFTPPSLTPTSVTGGSGSSGTTINEGSTATNTIINNITTLKTQVASVTTTNLNPGDSFTGVLTMSRIFVLFQVSTSSSARVRLYATQSAQLGDISRASAQAPAYGTTQALIADVYLDTAPYLWLMTPVALGANGDSPTSPQAYVTVDNIGDSSETITASLTYLVLET
jgi:hypothetical protein